MLEVPAFDLYQRQLHNGLTTYSYDEIVEAIAATHEIEQECAAVVAEASAIIDPHSTGLGTYVGAPDSILALARTLELYTPTFTTGDTHRGSRELYPVSTWYTQIATYRNVIRKIRRAIELAKVESEG